MSFTLFSGTSRLASGSLADIALLAREHPAALIFDDETGRQIDIDTKGTEAEIRARYTPAAKGPGRPKLGVTAREVTLLPRHWDWLARQPGGASVALRKLVEAAARGPKAGRDSARNAAYSFAAAMAGNLPGYEEAMRALYAGKRKRFHRELDGWPPDIRTHLEKMAAPAFADDD